MQTIQEAMKNINKDELIRAYIYDHPHEIQDKKQPAGITLQAVWDEMYNTLDKLIEQIRTTDIEKTEDEMIIFGFENSIASTFEDDTFHVVKKDDVLNYKDGDRVEQYAYELRYISETAGFYIADTEYNKHWLISLLESYLYETSFFGYEQEYIEEEVENLKKADKEIKEGHYKTYSMEDLYKEFGIYKDYDEHKEELEHKILRAQNKWFEYAFYKEIKIIQKQLKENPK